jgi:hypothetical protein
MNSSRGRGARAWQTHEMTMPCRDNTGTWRACDRQAPDLVLDPLHNFRTLCRGAYRYPAFASAGRLRRVCLLDRPPPLLSLDERFNGNLLQLFAWCST